MKKIPIFILTFLLAASVISATFTAPTAYAQNSDNYEVYIPDSHSYIYLRAPQKIAVSADTIAVYDSELNKIIIMGAYSAVFDNVDNIKQLALSGSSLFALTEDMELYLYNAESSTVTLINQSEDLVQTPMLIAADSGYLYAYDGYRSICKIDIATLTTTAEYKNRKPLEAEDFAVCGDKIVILGWNDNVIEYDFTAAQFTVTQIESAHDRVVFINGEPVFADTLIDSPVLSISKTLFNSLGLNSVVDLAANGSYLYIICNNIITRVKSKNGELSYDSEYGSSSKVAGRFDTPVTMAASKNNLLAVADNGNNRIQVFNMENNLSSVSFGGINAISLTWGDDILYALTSSKLYSVSDSVTTMDYTDGITRILYTNGTLFGYNSITKKIMVYTEGGFLKNFANIGKDVLSLKASATGKIVYALTSEGIYGYTVCGKQSAELNLSVYNGAVDFEVDKVGNFYVLFGGENAVVRKYGRTYIGYTLLSETTLNAKDIELKTVVSITSDLDGNLYVLSQDRHFVAKLNIDSDFVTAPLNSSAPSLSNITNTSDISFAEVNNCVLYTYNNNYEDISCLGSEKLTVFNTVTSENSALSYVMTKDGTFGYVDNGDLSMLNSYMPDFSNIKMLHINGGDIYKYPSTESSAVKVHLDNQTPMTITGNACDFNYGGKYWYSITYTLDNIEYNGFVLRTKVLEYIPLSEPAETEFAKISDKFGNTVNMYYLADDRSEIVTTLTEGTKVELLQAIDNTNTFTLVRYNGSVGYVLTAYLKDASELTNGQIIGIVIAAITISATSVFLLVRKNATNSKKR